jgi:hypothetical protein
MRNIVVTATIPVGLLISAAWVAFLAFELFRFVAFFFWNRVAGYSASVTFASINFGAAGPLDRSIKPRSEVVFAEDGGDGELWALDWHGLDRLRVAFGSLAAWGCDKSAEGSSAIFVGASSMSLSHRVWRSVEQGQNVSTKFKGSALVGP